MKYLWFAAGIVTGTAGLALFLLTLEVTSADRFCMGCHEMHTPRDRLLSTRHGVNPHGTVASCADCHVPREPVPKLIRKVTATRELWSHLQGTLDTPEAYAAMRPIMQEREWSRLKASDSAECRNCHQTDSWQLEEQGRMARRAHAALQAGKTCIDCHQGIAHPVED